MTISLVRYRVEDLVSFIQLSTKDYIKKLYYEVFLTIKLVHINKYKMIITTH